MANRLGALDGKVQAIRGSIGARWGESYNLYRLGSSANVSVLDTTPIAALTARIDRETSKTLVENQTFDLLAFEAMVNAGNLALGDILVEQTQSPNLQLNGAAILAGTATLAINGIYAVAQKRPTRETMLVRCEQLGVLTAPNSNAGTLAQAPAFGSVFDPQWAGNQEAIELPLTLTSGSYALATAPGATPAVIPFGLQPIRRVHDENDPDVVADFSREEQLAYIPPLGSFEVQRLMILTLADGTRFQIRGLYSSQLIGVAGTVAVVEFLKSTPT
jgi:hypothetical protein